MKNNLNIDRLTKDILRNSHLEVTGPDFDKTVMRKVLRENHKQHMILNSLICISVFALIDTLLFFIIRFFKLDIFSVTLWPGKISSELFSHGEKIKDSILQNGITKYAVLLLIVMVVADLISESKIKLLERDK